MITLAAYGEYTGRARKKARPKEIRAVIQARGDRGQDSSGREEKWLD